MSARKGGKISRISAVKNTEICLQKTLRNIVKLAADWKEANEVSFPSLKRMQSLCSQLNTCRDVNLDNTSLSDFKDIQSKLNYKIEISLEEELTVLRNSLRELENTYKKVASECEHAVQIFNESCGKIGLVQLTTASAFHPSISDLLEDVDIILQFFRQEFLRRKYSLLAIDFRDCKSLENLEKEWRENPEFNFSSDFWLPLQFFLATDLETPS